jgi:hypothetical protein
MIALTNGISRIVHLNRNERALQEIKAQLNDAYRDFLVPLSSPIALGRFMLIISPGCLCAAG